jgi:hypothetical protein
MSESTNINRPGICQNVIDFHQTTACRCCTEIDAFISPSVVHSRGIGSQIEPVDDNHALFGGVSGKIFHLAADKLNTSQAAFKSTT